MRAKRTAPARVHAIARTRLPARAGAARASLTIAGIISAGNLQRQIEDMSSLPVAIDMPGFC